MSVELTVIVPCYGRVRALANLLASFERQSLDPSRYEVFLVDDGTEPSLASQLNRPLPANIRWLQQANAGPGAARNTALEMASGRVLHFLNSDAVLHPETLARHLAHHPAGSAPKAVLGRFDWLPEQQLDPLITLLEAGDFIFPYDELLGELKAGRQLSFRYFWTGNLSVPAAPVRQVGGFDTGFRRAIWEDIEIGLRLENIGVPLVFDGDIHCGHDHPMDLAGYLRRCWKLGHDWVRLALKHGHQVMPILGNLLEPTRQTAMELLAALLTLDTGHRHRLSEFETKLSLAKPGQPASKELLMLLGGVSTHETLRGILCGLCGTPPESIMPVAGVRTIAIVVMLHDDASVDYAAQLAHSLGRKARVLGVRLPHSPPREPAGVELVTEPPASPQPPEVWRPILAAADSDIYIFADHQPYLDGGVLQRIRDALRVAPGVGAVGVAAEPLAHAAFPTEELAPGVLAVRRGTLKSDSTALGGARLADRLRLRGLLYAEVAGR